MRMKEIRQQPGVITDILRHSRHEWLNQLQLIKGYLELGDKERVCEIIDEIVFQANQETTLSNLKMNKTAELFLTYNWDVHNYKIEFEILLAQQNLSFIDDVVYNWVDTFLQIVDNGADIFYDNFLSITIAENEEGYCFIFDFSGRLKDITELKQYVGKQNNELDVHMHECTLNVFSIEMRVKR
ncbi:MAG: Spo0B C-terminal domain-containing protein [Bacillaceae bacterium]